MERPRPVAVAWEWQLQAACRGMDVEMFFHPDQERNPRRSQRISQAKRICGGCPVIDRCRTHALAVRESFGVWGGLSEDERAAILGVRTLLYPGKSDRSAAVGRRSG